MAKRNTFFEDELIEKKVDYKQFLRVMKYVLPYKKLLIILGIMMLVSSLASLLPPRLLSYVVDVVVIREDIRMLTIVGGCLIFLAAVDIISSFLQNNRTYLPSHQAGNILRENK